MKQRLDWIDAARGIGIFLVVLGHNNIPQNIVGQIYSFHMPLFFLLSGYLFNPDKYQEFWQFLKKKSQSLILPYFAFFIILYLYWIIFGRTHGTVDTTLIYQPLLDILYSSEHLHNTFVALWFLTGLFVTEILFYWLVRLFKKDYIIIISVIIASIFGYLYSHFTTFRLPWSADTAFLALVFFGGGYFLKKQNFLKKMQPNIITKVGLILILFAINLIFFKLNGRIDLFSNLFGNYFYFYLGGFSGIFGCIFLAKFIPKLKFFNYLGQNSLVIFGLHPIGVGIAKNLLSPILGQFFDLNRYSLISGLIYSIICIVLLVPAIWLFNSYFPYRKLTFNSEK